MQSNRVMVIIAVVAGVVAMAAAFGYLRTASGSLAKEPAEAAISIVVAKTDLPADHLIDAAADLDVQRVPSKTFAFLARAAVKGDEKAALRGRRLNMPIAAGSPIMYSHLVGVTDLEITQGSRAFTIDIDETGVIGGILVPGDRVDIVVSWKLPSAKGGSDDRSGRDQSMSQAVGQAVAGAMETRDWAARAALSNVKVLAVGDKLIRSREQFTFGDPSAKAARRSSAGTITLEVTTEEALELIRSMGGGENRLYVLLRGKQGGQQPGTVGGGTILE
jgi:pilus assembly protein CpaB